MNTREINSSAWPLKYFFIAAFPLVVITIGVPLYFITVVTFLTRISSQKRLLLICIKELLLLVLFIVTISADIRYLLYGNPLPDELLTYLYINYLAFSAILLIKLGKLIRSFMRDKLRPAGIEHFRGLSLYIRNHRRFIFSFFLGISLWLDLYLAVFVQVPFFIFRYLNIAFDYRRQKKVLKTI